MESDVDVASLLLAHFRRHEARITGLRRQRRHFLRAAVTRPRSTTELRQWIKCKISWWSEIPLPILCLTWLVLWAQLNCDNEWSVKIVGGLRYLSNTLPHMACAQIRAQLNCDNEYGVKTVCGMKYLFQCLPWLVPWAQLKWDSVKFKYSLRYPFDLSDSWAVSLGHNGIATINTMYYLLVVWDAFPLFWLSWLVPGESWQSIQYEHYPWSDIRICNCSPLIEHPLSFFSRIWAKMGYLIYR